MRETMDRWKRIMERNDDANVVEFGPTAARSWGGWELIDRDERYKVRRLYIEPGRELNPQRHFHRDEHWVITSGMVEAKFDSSMEEDWEEFHEGENFHIIRGDWHQVRNPGKMTAVAIEVQTGEYLEEDDVEFKP